MFEQIIENTKDSPVEREVQLNVLLIFSGLTSSSLRNT
jgi:hypothetical protein